jgi:hypothetical protein
MTLDELRRRSDDELIVGTHCGWYADSSILARVLAERLTLAKAALAAETRTNPYSWPVDADEGC